jgi:hypothetical protein
MIISWGTLTIGAGPVQIPGATLPVKVCYIQFQVAPGAAGAVKVGGLGLDMTNGTPGTLLNATQGTNPDGSAQAGGAWSAASYGDHNTINASALFIHGSNPGDVVFVEYHQN